MQRESNLERLIGEGESQTLEFKQSLAQRTKALESLCAMVNSDTASGRIVFGVKPDGSVCGIEEGNLDKAQRSLAQTIESKFQPPLKIQIEIRGLSGGKVVLLSARRDRTVAYHEYDGRAWIREGTRSRQLTLTEKQHLMRTRNRDFHTGPWKCDKCGRLVGQLFGVLLTNEGIKKSFLCGCGGEYWPVTWD